MYIETTFPTKYGDLNACITNKNHVFITNIRKLNDDRNERIQLCSWNSRKFRVAVHMDLCEKYADPEDNGWVYDSLTNYKSIEEVNQGSPFGSPLPSRMFDKLKEDILVAWVKYITVHPELLTQADKLRAESDLRSVEEKIIEAQDLLAYLNKRKTELVEQLK